MTTNRKKALRRIGLISGAGLIAITVSALPGASSSAAVSSNQQIAEGQGQQKNPPPPPQQQNQKNNQHGGSLQYRQGGQPPYQQGGQQQYQQGGQQQYQQSQRYNWGSYQPGHQPPQWNQYHRNFDPRPYQWNQYADHSYRWQPYQPPRGWYDRRWAYGQILPAPFWARNYWLGNYWNFGLIDPPYGYVWVRYGNDALLVNVITGRILGSVYWLFY
jgi:hypothetical protein